MPRHKDQNWNLPDGTPSETGGRTHSWESIHAAVLMDIRDELKSLNRLLHCQNFTNLPRVLKRIDKRLAKKVPLR